jgi:hypothetical protein
MMRSWRFGLVLGVLVAGLALLAAGLHFRLVPNRLNPFLPLDLSEPPGLLTDAKLWLIGNETASCSMALARAGVAVKPLPRQAARPGCIRDGTVLVSRLSEARMRDEEMRCDVALRLYLLERHAIQPLARKLFSAGVSEIMHFGSYSCRTMRGSSRRMSEHASANAFDISGFKLGNGRLITLKKDWTADSAAARFLREVRASSCNLFNMTLSPDYNADHADHFHVDMGLFRGCH